MTQKLLILDVHGVVLNSPLPRFLADLEARYSSETSTKSRWAEIRTPFWEGRMSEAEMWATLAPNADPISLRNELESRYRPGPYYDFLFGSNHRCWLLTNHRVAWLMPRLKRFDLESRFEKIFVSDEIGAAKPSQGAFAPVVKAAGSYPMTFVDDNIRNIEAATEAGMNAVLADASTDWTAL